MIRVCSQCHSPDVAAEQQLDAAGWKDLVDQMASKGANATDDEFDEIVRYLTDAFPATK
jgi:competence protein ComEA